MFLVHGQNEIARCCPFTTANTSEVNVIKASASLLIAYFIPSHNHKHLELIHLEFRD